MKLKKAEFEAALHEARILATHLEPFGFSELALIIFGAGALNIFEKEHPGGAELIRSFAAVSGPDAAKEWQAKFLED